MKLTFYMVGILATGLIAIPPVAIAHGISAGHMSFGHPYGAYGVSCYDADYCYTPTAAQMATAQEKVHDYLWAVKKGRKHAATHRYISVETLRPTKEQLEDYTKKHLPQRPAEPSQPRCLMVFDTQSKQFVGSGCYVVTGKPSIGEVEKFETVNAEFVGQGTL